MVALLSHSRGSRRLAQVLARMKQHLIYLGASALITVLLYWLVGIGVGWAALIAFLGWPILGTVITADDDLPGGWSNPDGTRKPDWQTSAFGGNLFGRGAIVCGAFLAQLGLSAPWPAFLVPAGAASALVAAYLFRRSRASQHAG